MPDFIRRPLETVEPIASSGQSSNRYRIVVRSGSIVFVAAGLFFICFPGGDPDKSDSISGVRSSGSITGPTGSPENTSVAAGPASSLAPASTQNVLPFNKSPHYTAALAVAGMEEDETRVEAIEALMQTWVNANPKQAADWAGSLPSGTFRDDALSALMVHWAAQSPPNAALWMTRTGVDDGEATSALAGTWAMSDPAAAARWAASVENLESRRLAAASIASAWAATSPQAAASYAESLPINDRSAAITATVSTWAIKAPAEAGAWLNRTPFVSENDRAVAVAALITSWTTQSPAAASKYINSIPEGPAREAAASQFAVTAASAAPAEALMWGMNLVDPDQRNQVIADACESWYDGSPETFRQGISEALTLMEDPIMRRGVYEMLYERDPAFQGNLIRMADPATMTPMPLTPVPTPAPVLDETILFPK